MGTQTLENPGNFANGNLVTYWPVESCFNLSNMLTTYGARSSADKTWHSY